MSIFGHQSESGRWVVEGLLTSRPELGVCLRGVLLSSLPARANATVPNTIRATAFISHFFSDSSFSFCSFLPNETLVFGLGIEGLWQVSISRVIRRTSYISQQCEIVQTLSSKPMFSMMVPSRWLFSFLFLLSFSHVIYRLGQGP